MVGRISTGMGWNHAAAISRSASREGACWGGIRRWGGSGFCGVWHLGGWGVRRASRCRFGRVRRGMRASRLVREGVWV